MAAVHRILAINPGSTSTKIACFDDEECILDKTLRHSSDQLAEYDSIESQFPLRREAVLTALEEADIPLSSLDAAVGRGGLLHPVQGGTYAVNDQMLQDLKAGVSGEHASNLGGILAYEVAQAVDGVPSFIVDPVVVDELQPQARYSGTPLFNRTSIFHALNQKAVARRAARDMGKAYEDTLLIVAHLGGGITVGAHRFGRVVDVNDGLNGEGPFTPERSGGLPAQKLVNVCFSGEYDLSFIKKMIKGHGGLVAYLSTNDGLEVSRRIDAGDVQAREVLQAMAYQVAKEIGAMAAALGQAPEAIVITGGYAHDRRLVGWIKSRVSFMAPVMVYPGEDEMLALAQGALRVLRGKESALEYRGEATLVADSSVESGADRNAGSA